MNTNTKTTPPHPKSSTKTNAPQALREIADRGASETRETLDKMSATTTEAADLIRNSFSTAVKGAQDYNNKFVEFVHANTNAAFEFLQRLSNVKSPSAFVALSTEHTRQQLETLTEQTRQLSTLAQKSTLATAEPLKTGIAKAFNLAA